MSRRIFDRYRAERYADAPDGLAHNDPNVPQGHLMEYNGRQVSFNYVDMPAGIAFGGVGTLELKPAVLTIRGDSGHLHLSTEVLGAIEWQEDVKSYVVFDGKVTIKPM